MSDKNLPELDIDASMPTCKPPMRIKVGELDPAYDGGSMCHMDGCCNDAWEEITITWPNAGSKTALTAHVCAYHLVEIGIQKEDDR